MIYEYKCPTCGCFMEPEFPMGKQPKIFPCDHCDQDAPQYYGHLASYSVIIPNSFRATPVYNRQEMNPKLETEHAAAEVGMNPAELW